MYSITKRHGFTLIELLLVIGIIAILASIVIVAINPTRQMGQTRDAQRRSDVNTILNAVFQYAVDNNGPLPPGIPAGTPKGICKSTAATCVNGVNLNILVDPYLVKIPFDPKTSTATGTSYTIVQDANGRVTVTAPGAELSSGISVTR